MDILITGVAGFIGSKNVKLNNIDFFVTQ